MNTLSYTSDQRCFSTPQTYWDNNPSSWSKVDTAMLIHNNCEFTCGSNGPQAYSALLGSKKRRSLRSFDSKSAHLTSDETTSCCLFGKGWISSCLVSTLQGHRHWAKVTFSICAWGLKWFGFEQFRLFLTRLKRTMCQLVITSLWGTEFSAKYPDLSPLTVTLLTFHQGNLFTFLFLPFLSAPAFPSPSAGLLYPLAKFLQWFHLFHCFPGLSNLGKKNTPCRCSAMAAVAIWCCKSDILFHNKALTACFFMQLV